MSPDKSETSIEEETGEDRLRKGKPVIKTSLEMDRDLYYEIKEELAKKNTSLKDFLSRAAHEKLSRSRRPQIHQRVAVDYVLEIIERNPFARKVLDLLEKEIPHPFGTSVLVSKTEKYEVDLEELSPTDLTDEFIDELTRPVDLVSGPEAAENLTVALKNMRGG